MPLFIQTQTTVNGEVRVKLFKGNATVVGRKSENSLYDFELATYNPKINLIIKLRRIY